MQDMNMPPVAYQQTGNKGKVTFAYLSEGVYRIKIILPQQSRKYIRGKDRIDCKLQVGYHKGDKRYFLNEDEGCFTVEYSKLRDLENKNITPVYNLEYDNGNKEIEIGRFEVSGNKGSLTLSVMVQKPKRFRRMVEKVINDVEMIIIRNL